MTESAPSPVKRKIAVDLTPMLPGGENGGAKPMILALLKHLPALMPDCEFILLTASASHEELAYLERPNLSRLCVRQFGLEQTKDPSPASTCGKLQFFHRIYQRLKQFLPARLKPGLKKLAYCAAKPASLFSPSLLSGLHVDLLFCPFTAPTFSEPQIPTVSLLHDIQAMSYPQFFAPDDLIQREQNFQETIRKANHIITVSDFVRATVLEYANTPASITTIHHGLVQAFPPLSQAEYMETLRQFGIDTGNYLLYPANFWQHKNHAMLLTAFRLFLEEHPQSELQLVCTGALESRRAELLRAAQIMGLAGRVVFPGFLPSAEVGALYQHALALIFPSLYEGFGIPLLEAFAAEIPVLCSNVTSLPEVGGDAVLYFDPFKPREIADAIAKITGAPALRGELTAKGKQRLEYFGGAERMAREYADLLLRVLETPLEYAYFDFVGVTGDGWLQAQASLCKPRTLQKASAELRLNIPPWVPQSLHVKACWGHSEIGAWKFPAGREHAFTIDLPAESGSLSLSFAPGFIPSQLGIGEDARLLSALCVECKIKTEEGAINLCPPGAADTL